jgi:hypothetical protein
MTVFLIVFAVLAVWAVSLLVHPFGACWRCGGKGNVVRKGRRKAPKCRVCKGKGRRQRTGSRVVHRVRRTAVAGWQARKDGA